MAETSATRLSRMLALVPWLIAHDGVTIDEAAAHFDITADQLEKDLWLLVVCGLPGYGPDQLVDIDFWEDGRIHVLDPQTLDRPLRLTADEAVSLLAGLRLIEQVPGAHDRAAITSAIAKIESAVSEAAGSGSEIRVVMDLDPGVRATIEAAVRSGESLTMTYAGATADEVTERTIAPLSIDAVDGRAYLEAYCFLAGARRTFRLDRILAISPATSAEELPELVGVDRPMPSTAHLRVDASAVWIADAYAGERVDGADGIRVLLPYRDPSWLVRLVLSLGGRAEVVEPADLRELVALAAADALRAYAEGH